MARRERGPLSDLLQRASLGHWTRAARGARSADLSALRLQRSRARALKARLEDVLAVADDRLALPRHGSDAFPRPPGTDWAWRPPLWRQPLPGRGVAGAASPTRLGDGSTIFHDCAAAEIAVAQVRNQRSADLAPFGLRLEVFGFEGTYLSLVLDLPPEAAAGLRRRHLLRLGAEVACETPIGLLARLNVKHGPNVEQLSRELSLGDGEVLAEFDLAYVPLNEKRVDRMWLDLIFQAPEMNRILLRDLTLARYPRADF